MPENEYGPLAAALAKAQAAFPAIQRDKEVEVKLKTGGSYKFKYAPLDTILTATRKALTDNGLAVVQLLDDGELVTMLLHESGARLSGRVGLPTEGGVQELGSAITYLRRYSIQAILGIAAEEDDDGNRAAGNLARPVPGAPRIASDRRPADTVAETAAASPFQTTETGTIEFASKPPADGELRTGPDGSFLVFRFLGEDGKAIIPQVAAYGPLAEALMTLRRASDFLTGTKAVVHGVISRVPMGQGSTRTFQRMALSRIETAEWTLPAPISVASPETAPHPVPAPLDASEAEDLAAVTDRLWEERQPEEPA